jgi:hypothetical protein
MLFRLYTKVKLWIRPPKSRDAYCANPKNFVIGKPIEQVLHGLKNKHGETIYFPMPSDDCYRLTIESDVMPYYICMSEVFIHGKNWDNNFGLWMKRSQPKRIGKDYFKQLIVDGILRKV